VSKLLIHETATRRRWPADGGFTIASILCRPRDWASEGL